MRVLVIGGGGLLGLHLVPRIMSAGHEVAVCDNFSGSIQYRAPKDVRTYIANATDLNSLARTFNTYQPEVVVVALAHHYSADTIYRFFEDTKLSLEGANVLSFLLTSEVKQVVFCSSHEVYGGSLRPISESKRIDHSSTHHGAAKLSAELVLRHRCKELGISLAVVRLFDLFGPRIMFCPRTGVVNFLISSLLSNEQIGLAGAQRLRDFIHVEDAAEAITQLLSANFSGTVNLGTGVGVTLRQLVSELSSQLDVVYSPVELPDPRGKSKSLVANISRIKEAIPTWKPEHTVLESLPGLVDFRRKESKLYNNSASSSAQILRIMRGLEVV